MINVQKIKTNLKNYKMKLQIIETADYILAVSDEEIKVDDYVFDNFCEINLVLKIRKCDFDSSHYRNKNWKKIIAYLPKNNDASELDLPLLPEMVVEDNVEKLAENYKNKKGSIPTTELEDEIFKLGFKDGYNKCLENLTK